MDTPVEADKKLYVDLALLKEWDKNPRRITKKDFDRLMSQIQKLGQYKPLLVTPDYTVIGGNMRLKAYRELNYDKVWVSIVTPKNEDEMLEYALSDNDRAGYYDEDMLANMLPNYDIDLSNYAVDLREPTTLDSLNREGKADGTVPEAGSAKSQRGKVYKLGDHRLMCGDANSEEDLRTLMNGAKADMIFTDPPYGMDLDTDYSNLTSENSFASGKKHTRVIGDDKPFDARFLMDMADEVLLFGADYYVDTLPNFGKEGSWMIWDKRIEESSDNGFGSNFEMLWSKRKHKRWLLRQKWFGFFTAGEDRTYQHPTEKPVKLLAEVMGKINGGDGVLDLFGGSGSTLIACEQTNRTCYMMELDPKYCDVIRKRYVIETLGEEKVNEFETHTPEI